MRNKFNRRALNSYTSTPKIFGLRSKGIASRNSKNSVRQIDNPQNPSSFRKKRIRAGTKQGLRSLRVKINDSTLQSDGELPAVKKNEKLRPKWISV